VEWLALLGGLTSAALGVTVALLGIRNGGLKADARHADTLRKAAEAALKVGTTEFDDYRKRAELREANLVAELEHYENEELDAIEAEPDRPRRIERRRNWVRSVLSKASSPTSDDSEDGVREEGTS
jgi:hypothetical protein